MFLVENYIEENTSISADPMCGMEIIQEATDDLHQISMAMIKLEHTAILTENSELLNEGIKDFAKKTSETIKRAWEKFKVYLEKVYVTWTNLQAKLATMFLSQDKVKTMLKNVTDAKITFKGDVNKFMDAYKKISDKIKSFSNLDEFFKEEENFNTNLNLINAFGAERETTNAGVTFNSTSTYIDRSSIQDALRFIQDRRILISQVKAAKTKLEAKYKEAIAAAEKGDHSKAKEFTEFQRKCNKIIIAINKITIVCTRVCRAALKQNKSEESEKKDEGNKSESVLDYYF